MLKAGFSSRCCSNLNKRNMSLKIKFLKKKTVLFRIHDGSNANPVIHPCLAIRLKAVLLYLFSSFSVSKVNERFQNLKKFDAVVSKGKKAIFVYFIGAGSRSKKKKLYQCCFYVDPDPK